MSFDRSHLSPNVDTHVPVTVHIPAEKTELISGRPDEPTPSLWQKSVMVSHRDTGRRAVVLVIDWATNMFRPFFPDEGERGEDGKPLGKFSGRTEWEHCKDWMVEVTLSPAEMERQAARDQLAKEIATLDPKALGWVTVLADDADPTRALAKLNALREAGIIPKAVSVEAAAEAVAEVKAPKPKGPAKAKPEGE